MLYFKQGLNLTSNLKDYQDVLLKHPLYSKINDLEDLRIFMQGHVFAVWDFMSLLKSLQRKLTCVELPWRPSPYGDWIVRMINEIVLGEESDIDPEGVASGHFSLYLKAMQEISADTTPILNLMKDLNFNAIPRQVREVVLTHLDWAQNGKLEEVAAAFFWGREGIIPEMFERIVFILEKNKIQAPTLIYYFKRHIEVDGQDHGPKAMKLMDALLDDPEKKSRAIQTGIHSLKMRIQLWDYILQQINSRSQLRPDLLN